MTKLFIVAVRPIQQLAAEPETLEWLTAPAQQEIRDRIELPTETGHIGSVFDLPVVPDASLPPGLIQLRPNPTPHRSNT